MFLLVCLVVAVSTLSTARQQLSIDYIYSDTRGRLFDGQECNEVCTPVFKICVSTEQSSTPLDCDSSAVLYPVIITQPYYHTDNVTFGRSIGGQDNPVSYFTPDTFNGSFSILIEVNNYNTPNASIQHIDTLFTHIHTTQHNNYSNVVAYTGSRAVYPSITAVRYKLTQEGEVKELRIANGGMGIFKNTMQLIFLCILIGIFVLLILCAVCCMGIICRVRNSERRIIRQLPRKYFKRRRHRQGAKSGLLDESDRVHTYDTFN